MPVGHSKLNASLFVSKSFFFFFSCCATPDSDSLQYGEGGHSREDANSKHWFTTSFIQVSTTAVFSYAIGSRKLSANEQFFVGAQTVVNLLQTTQIKQGVSFITANKVYTSTNKTTIV